MCYGCGCYAHGGGQSNQRQARRAAKERARAMFDSAFRASRYAMNATGVEQKALNHPTHEYAAQRVFMAIGEARLLWTIAVMHALTWLLDGGDV